MNSDRIKEIQQTTAYPDSISVHQALLQVWNECEQEGKSISPFNEPETTDEEIELVVVGGSEQLCQRKDCKEKHYMYGYCKHHLGCIGL